MKKWIALLLASVLLLSACGKAAEGEVKPVVTQNLPTASSVPSAEQGSSDKKGSADAEPFSFTIVSSTAVR